MHYVALRFCIALTPFSLYSMERSTELLTLNSLPSSQSLDVPPNSNITDRSENHSHKRHARSVSPILSKLDILAQDIKLIDAYTGDMIDHIQNLETTSQKNHDRIKHEVRTMQFAALGCHALTIGILLGFTISVAFLQ